MHYLQLQFLTSTVAFSDLHVRIPVCVRCRYWVLRSFFCVSRDKQLVVPTLYVLAFTTCTYFGAVTGFVHMTDILGRSDPWYFRMFCAVNRVHVYIADPLLSASPTPQHSRVLARRSQSVDVRCRYTGGYWVALIRRGAVVFPRLQTLFLHLTIYCLQLQLQPAELSCSYICCPHSADVLCPSLRLVGFPCLPWYVTSLSVSPKYCLQLKILTWHTVR